jgi:hypothetical protein
MSHISEALRGPAAFISSSYLGMLDLRDRRGNLGIAGGAAINGP